MIWYTPGTHPAPSQPNCLGRVALRSVVPEPGYGRPCITMSPPPRFHSPPRNTTTPGNRSRNARAASGPELTESPLIVNPSPSPPRAHMCTSGHQGSRSGETGGGNESPPPRSLSFFPGSPPSQRTAVLNGVFYAPHKTTPLEGCHRH